MGKKIKELEDVTNDIPEIKIEKSWVKFFDKLHEYKDYEPRRWNNNHILGYICDKFNKTFGREYRFVMTGAPSKSKELFFIKKLINTLGTIDQNIIKNYIDWVFDKKIIARNKKITSIGFFANGNFVNEFLFEPSYKYDITKRTALPSEYIDLANSFGVVIKTYGDLKMIKLALEQNENNPSREPYKHLIQGLKQIGLNDSVLEKLK